MAVYRDIPLLVFQPFASGETTSVIVSKTDTLTGSYHRGDINAVRFSVDVSRVEGTGNYTVDIFSVMEDRDGIISEFLLGTSPTLSVTNPKATFIIPSCPRFLKIVSSQNANALWITKIWTTRI